MVSALHPFTGSEAPPRGKVKRVRLRDVANTEPLSAILGIILAGSLNEDRWDKLKCVSTK